MMEHHHSNQTLAMPNAPQEIFEDTVVGLMLQRVANSNPDAALRSGLTGNTAGLDNPNLHLAAYGTDDQALRQAIRDGVAIVAMASGIKLVVNPGRDEVLAEGTLVVVDETNLDAEFAQETLDTALQHARERKGPVCVLGMNLVPGVPKADERFAQAFAQANDLVMLAAVNPSSEAVPDGFDEQCMIYAAQPEATSRRRGPSP